MAQFSKGSVGLFFRGDPTLRAWYPLNGNSVDFRGGYNGTDTNISYSSLFGKFGYGARFNGSATISIPNFPIYFSALTVNAWVYPTLANSLQKQIVFFGSGGATTQLSSFQLLWESNNVNSTFGVYKVNPNGWFGVNAPFASTINNWYMVTGVWIWGPSPSRIFLYINGNLVASTSFNDSSKNDGTNSSIGSYNRTTNSQTFQGYIDEVAIFSRVLSPKEIKAYYNWAIGKSTPIIYTPRKNASVLNVERMALPTIKARRGLIMSM